MAIPTKDALLAPYSINMNTRLVASGVTTYKLTAPQVAGYTSLHDLWIAAYNELVDARAAGNRSESLTMTKDDAKKGLLQYARQLYGIIRSNESIPDADKVLIGVRRTVVLNIHDAASPAKRRKPAGCVCAWVYSFVGTEYPSDPAAWTFEGATSKARFDVAFSSDVAGGTQVWLRAAWVNAKQQAGPMSVPVSTTLQGGGAVPVGGTLKVAA
jgi:hypothetical protein